MSNKRGDPATEMLDCLLSKPKNMEVLRNAYQVRFEEDPSGVIESLLKLVPKSERERVPSDPPKGVDIVCTTAADQDARGRVSEITTGDPGPLETKPKRNKRRERIVPPRVKRPKRKGKRVR